VVIEKKEGTASCLRRSSFVFAISLENIFLS